MAAGACLLAAALGAAAAEEREEGGDQRAAAAPVRVHDHTAFEFTAADGARSPAQRAAEASDNLSHVVDDEIPGEVTVDIGKAYAQFKVGERPILRLVPADATPSSLAEYAPRMQAQLTDFLRTERQRARLQHGFLRASLAVFFAVLCYLLIRLLNTALRSLETRLRGDHSQLPADLRRLARGPWRSIALMALAAVRIFAWLAAVLLFLLATLSLFDSTRPWRDRLAAGVADPFSAFLHRLGGAVPSLVLLALLGVVLRGAWLGITQAFERAAKEPLAEGGIPGERVRPYRLMARAGLLMGALLLLPFVVGGGGGLLGALGLLAFGAVALAAVPLIATAGVGAWALVGHEYRLGEWLRLEFPGGREVTGEVTGVDFTHVRLVPSAGGEVRVPHLMTLFISVEHLPTAHSLLVEVPVPRESLSPATALARLQAAAEWVAAGHHISSTPQVALVDVSDTQARFAVSLAGAPQSLRNELLLALLEATSRLPESVQEQAERGPEQ